MKDEVMATYSAPRSSMKLPLETSHALLSLIGIGPGDLAQMTIAAQAALRAAEVVIGYEVYVELVRPLLRPEQEIVVSPIGSEMERAQQAVDLALAGRHVALISSGDIGIYAMASPVFEILRGHGWSGEGPDVEVFPGVSAVQAAAARLGAPLGHDFCTISLSDLLTPWPVIERRLQAAAWGDFVVAFYNPRSRKRDWQLPRAVEILLAHRPASTPVALVRHVTRPEEQIILTTLGELDPTQVDMFTLVLVGNSQSYLLADHFVTPRGYEGRSAGEPGSRGAEAQGSRGAGERYVSGDVYPVTLNGLAGKKAVVIGGGPVGQRKVQGLLAAGIAVRLVSPEATPQLRVWAEEKRIGWERRPYQPSDLTGASLVFAATNQRAVNAQVAQEAERLELLCNVADQPAEGNFHVPAVHRRPGLVVAVSTLGESPTRAKKVRDQIAVWLDNVSGSVHDR
jgi:cobalt-precorrin 5A hydrolase/precorrin-3B C17-methyltransferase